MKRRWLVLGALVIAGGALAVTWPRAPVGDAARPAPFAMRGSVTTVSGLPLADARVELFAIDETHTFTQLGHAATLMDGSYVLAFAPPAGDAGVVMIRASAPGCASESRSVELADRAQDFRLADEEARVVVHVEDAAGAPRAGASVLLTFEPIAAASGALYAWRADADATGAATFGGLPVLAGTLHVVAEHAHARVFAAHDKPAGAIRTELTARLARGRAVHGQLVAAAASGFPGAEVVLREVDGPWLARIPARADGSFDVPDAPIETPLVAEVTGDWVLAGDAPARPWRAPASASAAGDATGAAIAPGGPASASDPAVASGAPGTAPGPSARAPGPATRAPGPSAPAASASADRFVLTLDVVPGGGIDGVVLDTTGAPLGGASVTLASQGGFAGGARRVVTDGAGRFAVRGLPGSSTWSVEARYPGRAPVRRAPVAARTRDLELRVATGGTLVGRVVDRAGRGVADVEVYAHAMVQRASVGTGLAEYLSARTGPDGGYRLGALNPGHYRFEVRPTARMQWSATASTVRELDVHEGETPVDDATVARGAALRARIAPTDAPADPTIELAFQRTAEGGIPHRLVVQPTPDGELAVDALEAGSYRVIARSAARGYSTSADVTLVDGATAQVALRFAGTARLEGTVSAGGAPLASARIDVRRAGAFERAPDDFTGNWAAANPDGTFAIAGLSPGRWTVKITSESTAPVIRSVDLTDGTTRAAFTADAGAALDVTLRSTVRAIAGRVVLLEARDLPGFTVRTVADAEGHARFAHLPAGHYDVRAVVDGMPTASVELARGDRRVELRLE